MTTAMLRDLIDVVRKNFPRVDMPVDLLILLEIGHGQETGMLPAVKDLLAARLGAPATVKRSLQRLLLQGFVLRRRVVSDARSVGLVLSAKAWRRIENVHLQVGQLVTAERRRQRNHGADRRR